MQQLQFRIRGQTISRADRFFVVAKSLNYLKAGFEFITDDWDGLQKVALFTRDGTSYKMILDDGACMVPWELLAEPGEITVSAYGAGWDDDVILDTVNTATITVYESGYVEEAENQPEPTPEVWEQILSRLENIDGGLYTDWGDD